MITEVTMPSMGADMTEGTIVKWLKAEGDEVKRGDKIAEIETDKTVVEMESYNEGLLKKIVVGEGELVPVGALIAYIGGADDEVPEGSAEPAAAAAPAEEEKPAEEPEAETKEEPEAAPEPEPATAKAPEPAPQRAAPAPAPATAANGRVKASPIARRLAEEQGIDIAAVPGTGPGGRVTRDDVLGFRPSPAFATLRPSMNVQVDGSDIPLTNMRKAIARVTVRSKAEAPHYYVTHAVDMTDAMKFRRQLNEALSESGERVSVNDMILKAVVNALIKYPKWNAFFDGDKLTGHSDINIGIAIALDQGLIVPALMKAQSMTLLDISRGAKDLGKRARGEGGSLTQEELTQGTFGTSNLGMFGTDTFSAIIVPPQAGIVAVGAVKPTPVVRDDEIVVRQVMNATISADHRVGDGAEAAIFLGEVQKNLENPARLIV